MGSARDLKLSQLQDVRRILAPTQPTPLPGRTLSGLEILYCINPPRNGLDGGG